MPWKRPAVMESAFWYSSGHEEVFLAALIFQD
jgi:hypothetical protein